ncbi:hypothetical protein COB72_07605 [bacterium]|nr:MAG: hypothetical protein COB72_07605 [bacterium]
MKSISLVIMAATAGLATANPVLSQQETPHAFEPAGTPSASMTIDVSGWQFNDAQGSGLNQVLSIFVGHNAIITGIAWNLNLTSIGASWGSEAVMLFEGQINLTVSGDAAPVSNQNYDSMGVVDLTDAGVPNIIVSPDGILDIEFFETFVDNAGTGDAFFEPNSIITIYGGVLPTPNTLALIGLAGLYSGRRRR